MDKIKALYFKAGGENPEEIEIERDDLDEKYKLLECSTIDIIRRRFFEKQFFVICDDEGLLKENNIPSAFYINEKAEIKPALVGNLIICGIEGEDGELELGSLASEDVERIKRTMFSLIFKDQERGFFKAKAFLID